MIKHPRTTRTAIAAAASLLCTLAAAPYSASAQEAAQENQGIDKVIVTAQKREQAALDVPGSVAAVGAEQLQREGKVRLEDYVSQVPGLSLSSFKQGFTQVALRGITTGVAQSASSTSFYIDEAPIGSVNAYAAGSSITPDIDPADLARVEVLKGPQGTLYGAGAMGGMIRYVTSPADFRKFKGSVTVGANSVDGGDNGSVARAFMNFPFFDNKMAVRLSLFTRTDGGFIDNTKGKQDVNESKVEGGRLAFNWLINSSWKLQAFLLTQSVDSLGTAIEDVDAKTLKPLYGEFKQKRFVDEPSHAGLEVANLTLNGNLGMFDIVSSSTWQKVTSAATGDGSAGYGVALGAAFGIPDLGIYSTQSTSTERFSQELRAQASALDERLAYEVGVYYTSEDSTNRIPGFNPFSTTTGAAYPLPQIVKASIDTAYKEVSVFANATFALTPMFDIQAGVRRGSDDQKYTQDYRGLLVGPVPVVINSGSEESKSTYLVTARFKPTPTDSVYGKVSTGYRPGGPNAVPPATVPGAPQTFKPDALTSYELGYKTVRDNGKLSIEAAVFNTNWKDIQIQTSAGGFNFFVNGGAAISRGVEASVMYYPVKGLSLRATGGYTRAELDGPATAAGGVDGDALPFVPEVTGSLSANYRWAAFGNWSASVGGNVNYTGERKSDFSQRAMVDVPSFTTVSLNAGIENASWRLSLYGKNLNNARGITFVKSQSLAPAGNPFAAGIIAPRTIGLDLSYKF